MCAVVGSPITSQLSTIPPHCFQSATTCQLSRSQSSGLFQDVFVNQQDQAQHVWKMNMRRGRHLKQRIPTQLHIRNTHPCPRSNARGILCLWKRVVIYQHSCNKQSAPQRLRDGQYMPKMFLSQDVAKDRYLEAQLLGGKSHECEITVNLRINLDPNSRYCLTWYWTPSCWCLLPTVDDRGVWHAGCCHIRPLPSILQQTDR